MLTPKQEAFVLAYIETGNASEAYRQAGYKAGNAKTTNEAASRLLKNSKVIARLNALREKHVERHEVTIDSLVAELEEARALAAKIEAPAAMVAATMGKAKLYGKVIDKNELTGKDGGPIETADASPRDEFARRIAGVSARLGEAKAHNGANGAAS
jgi:phage terminase small subunit